MVRDIKFFIGAKKVSEKLLILDASDMSPTTSIKLCLSIT